MQRDILTNDDMVSLTNVLLLVNGAAPELGVGVGIGVGVGVGVGIAVGPIKVRVRVG